MSTASAIHCVHFRVSGLVQGVWYRASTAQTATGLGVRGWVRNCPNGDVELVACGTRAQLEALEQWLWQGPPAARVANVHRSDTEPEDYPAFEVRR